MTLILRRLRARLHPDSGNAIIEFVFLGVILLIPLVYLVIAVSTIQRSTFGVTQAAREVGRAYATTGNLAAARYAAQLAMDDQKASGNVDIGWVSGGSCKEAASGLPPLAAGEVFSVCVTRVIHIPAVPSFLAGSNNTVTGRFVVHVDDYSAP